MRIDIVSLFPELLEGVLQHSLLGRAMQEGMMEVAVVNPRDFTLDKHRSVDDTPYGGGAGMVMRCEPLFAAIESLREKNSLKKVILMSPRGRRLTQSLVREIAQEKDMVLICGRYEGVDERVSQTLVTDEISIGDYVLSGGEVPALVLVEAVSRMIPGVIGDWESVETDSFYEGILAPPQYTKPAQYRGMDVPELLLSGHHEAIRRWRRKEALRVTRDRRPDLLESVLSDRLSKEDKALMAELEREETLPKKENES